MKILIAQVLGNIVVQIRTKYQKDRIKSKGAYSIWKKVDADDADDWRRMARHRISSADYVSSGAKKFCH